MWSWRRPWTSCAPPLPTRWTGKTYKRSSRKPRKTVTPFCRGFASSNWISTISLWCFQTHFLVRLLHFFLTPKISKWSELFFFYIFSNLCPIFGLWGKYSKHANKNWPFLFHFKNYMKINLTSAVWQLIEFYWNHILNEIMDFREEGLCTTHEWCAGIQARLTDHTVP